MDLLKEREFVKMFLDCLPCILRQALEAAYEASDDEFIHERIMDDAIKIISDHKEYSYAPQMARDVHSMVKKHLKDEDPYRRIKDSDICQASKLVDHINDFISKSEDPLLSAIKASATGNIMDSAIFKDLDIKGCLQDELEKEFTICDIDRFKWDLKKGSKILIIGDNAGEGVFDKILIEMLSKDHHVTFAYRNQPIINDITRREVDLIGIGQYADLISIGSSAPGALPDEFSEPFKRAFYKSDMVISKGQGNFEALSDIDRDIYFLLKAKCSKIAMALNANIGDYVFQYKGLSS
jgi:uncharacterized protein with ATP-grasp and redox domains